MLTRLEVNGFKNLLDFSIDLGPFNCIAGLNGVGKSNILDAIEFLSFLSDCPITEAALRVRGEGDSSSPKDIFWTNGEAKSPTITMAAEMLVEEEVTDDFGRQAKASSTFLRYEIEIGYEKNEYDLTPGRMVLVRENLE